MKCYGCGHEFPITSTRCPRCHRSTSRRGRTPADSRLLEFPRRARIAPPVEAPTPPLPAWRAELNEKVRAIRARRSSDSSVGIREEEVAQILEVDRRAAQVSARKHEPRIPYGNDVNPRAATTVSESNQQGEMPASPSRRSSSNIVEAALTRVRRASENASRAALPKIEPARSIQSSPQVSLAVDREATARALEPAPEIVSRVEIIPVPKPVVVQRPVSKPAQVGASPPETQADEPAASAAAITVSQASVSSNASESFSIPAVEVSSIPVPDEIEPLDYLEAEIRKVDKALGAEFVRNESPTIFMHGVMGVVDLLTMAVSCSPFLAIIRIADGSFSNTQTRFASGAVVALISFFYLGLTQCLCGRTFGMMLTNTRVVDSRTFEAPSTARALLRTAGYFIAAAPAMLGIIWAVFNRKHRGWQDFISGTVVVRDF